MKNHGDDVHDLRIVRPDRKLSDSSINLPQPDPHLP